MRRWVGRMSAAILALAVCGCLSVGRDFRSSDFSWIVEKETTKEQVHRILGEPFRVGVESGMTTWTYGHYKYRVRGEARTKDLVLYFHPNGTVSSYTFNTSFPDEKAQWMERNVP